jgi:hypothetical protein
MSAATIGRLHSLQMIMGSKPDFPFVSCRKGDPLPSCETQPDVKGLTGHIQSHPSDWLAPSVRTALITQGLFPANGYSMTLLMLDNDDEKEELEL